MLRQNPLELQGFNHPGALKQRCEQLPPPSSGSTSRKKKSLLLIPFFFFWEARPLGPVQPPLGFREELRRSGRSWEGFAG